MSPWQPGVGLHMRGAVAHVMSGWSQAAWTACPSLSVVLPFRKGTINTWQTLAACLLCGATSEKGWNQGTPGMNLGWELCAEFVLNSEIRITLLRLC